MDETSGVKGDFHAPFCGSPGVRFPRATRRYWHTQRTLARWCRIRSYLDSAKNHGLRALDAIRAVLEGKPWLPPLPALA